MIVHFFPTSVTRISSVCSAASLSSRDQHDLALAPLVWAAFDGFHDVAVDQDLGRAERIILRRPPGYQALAEDPCDLQRVHRIPLVMEEILTADPAHRLVLIASGVRSAEPAPFDGERFRLRIPEDRLQAHKVSSVYRPGIRILRFIRFGFRGLPDRLHQAVRHDPVTQRRGMVLVEEEAFRFQFFPDMAIKPVLDGHHHQRILPSDPFQFILQVEAVPEDREQEDHRGLVRRIQDFPDHGFIASVTGRFLPVVHRVFNDHEIRQSVRIRRRYPVHDLPLIPHIPEGRCRAAHAGVHKEYIGAVLRPVCRPEPYPKPFRPALFIAGSAGAFGDRPADRRQRDVFTVLCLFDYLFQPGIVAGTHDRIFQRLEIPFHFKHRLFLSLRHTGTQQHQGHQDCRASF